MNKIYYVSANGGNTDGTDINNPMSLAAAIEKVYTDGDCVLLRSGDTFKAPIHFKTDVSDHSAQKRVKVSSYGEGEPPILTATTTITDPSEFVMVEPNVWKLDLCKSDEDNPDVLNNAGFLIDANDKVYYHYSNSYKALKNDLNYFFDGKVLFVYCEQNPVDRLGGSISVAHKRDILFMYSDTEYCGLQFKYSGAHAMVKGHTTTVENIYIHHNVIDFMGGSVLDFYDDGSPRRYGNGIEFFSGGTRDVLIEDNIVRNVYDTAFTMQGSINDWRDVTVRNNVFVKNDQSTEIWNMYDAKGVYGYEYYGNLSFRVGRGWGNEMRPNESVNCEVLFYHYLPERFEMTVHDNVMFDPARLYWWAIPETMHKFIKYLKSFKNTVYCRDDLFLINHGLRLSDKKVLEEDYKKEIDTAYNELSDSEKYSEMLHIAETSLSIDEIREAAKQNGIISNFE